MLGLPVAVGLVLGPGPTEASRSIEVAWQAPADCPTQAAVEARVAELLGPAALAGPREFEGARGTVDGESGAWRLTLEIETRSGVGQRTVESEDCASLAEVAALVVALAVDPLSVALATSEPPPAEPAPAPATEPAPAVSTSEPVVEVARAPARVSGFVSPRFGVSHGQLPVVGPTVALAVGVELRRARVEAVGTYLTPQTALRSVDDREVGGRYMMGYAALRGCPTVRLERPRGSLALPICVGLAYGGVRNDPIGLAQPRSATASWAAAQLSPTLSWRSGEYLALWLGVDASFSFVGAQFTAAGLDRPLHETAFFSVQGLLGLELHFE